jgi:hypothetical protein
MHKTETSTSANATLGNPDPAASYTNGDKRYFKNSLFHNPMLYTLSLFMCHDDIKRLRLGVRSFPRSEVYQEELGLQH